TQRNLEEHISFDNFFFQAEDGIRDFHVTGVQTCALPICNLETGEAGEEDGIGAEGKLDHSQMLTDPEEAATFVKATQLDALAIRSEERRVGKECRYRR